MFSNEAEAKLNRFIFALAMPVRPAFRLLRKSGPSIPQKKSTSRVEVVCAKGELAIAMCTLEMDKA